MTQVICHVTKQKMDLMHSYKADMLRDSLFHLIKRDYPDFSKESYVSQDALNDYRAKYVTELVKDDDGSVDLLEKEVLDAISGNKIVSENIEPEIEEHTTFGQRVADNIAVFGGSWTFIGIFFAILIGWMILNAWLLSNKPFDPFPFILLNLVLSCLAAIQAPIIMMSQNRQGEKDRQRSEHDYKINLKAELEIKLLHEKIDYLLIYQNKRLMEIQQINADYLLDLMKEIKLLKESKNG
jgi:uncharacterized membrane protein